MSFFGSDWGAQLRGTLVEAMLVPGRQLPCEVGSNGGRTLREKVLNEKVGRYACDPDEEGTPQEDTRRAHRRARTSIQPCRMAKVTTN